MNRSRAVAASSAVLGLCLGLSASSYGDPQKVKLDRIEVPSAVNRSLKLGNTDPNRTLHIAVSLPFADPAGMQAFVDSVSNPRSENYRQFLTPDEVGARFGLSDDKVRAVEQYLRSQGMHVNLVAKNHLSILADCRDRKSTRLNSSHIQKSRMPSSA